MIGTRGIPNQYGGFEQMLQFLAPGLAAKGHSVYVYNPHHHSYKENTWKGVNIIHRHDPEKTWGTAGQFIYDLNCINDARKRGFDVLLHFGYTSDAVFYSHWPRCINIVNMDGLEWKRSKYNRLTQRFLKWSEKLAATHANKLIADSPIIAEMLWNSYKVGATYIPYGAKRFLDPDRNLLEKIPVVANEYYLVIARMEPENNIEMIIRGWEAAQTKFPLIIVGNSDNNYGRHIRSKYADSKIKFTGSLYDLTLLNNLRYYCRGYFHGHSVGGTNPSLLEAMASGADIMAHDNPFNRQVLEGGHFFKSEADITTYINSERDEMELTRQREANYLRIDTQYSWSKIIQDYEALILEAVSAG